MKNELRAQAKSAAPSRSAWDWPVPWWISCLSICVVGILVYSNTFQNSFHFDDETSIINNPSIRQLGDLTAIWRYSPARFLTYLSFALNYRLGGLDVFGYHVVNLVIHLASALSLWLLVQQLSRTPALRGSGYSAGASLSVLLASLIFVAHPLQTQAVTYIAQRAASMATFFYLISLYCYAEARLIRQAGEKKPSVFLFLTASALSGIMALFSKETALTLPFAILMYEVFFLRSSTAFNWKFVATLVIVFLMVPMLLVLNGLIEFGVEQAIPAATYARTQPSVLMTYLRLVIFPINQNLDYDIPLVLGLFELRTLFSLALLLALGFTGARLFSTRRVLSFGIFWFFLTVLPESSVIPLPDVIYEHRLYLPMVGLAIALSFLFKDILKSWKPMAAWTVLACTVVALGGATYARNRVWTDDFTLWNDVIMKSPNKPRPYSNRGRAFLERKMYDSAFLDFNRALALNPAFGDAYSNRGNVYLMKGDYDRAIADYQNALKVGLSYASNYDRLIYNLGLAYNNKGDYAKAIENYTEAIRANSEEPSSYYNRAISYEKLGQLNEALADYKKAIGFNPRYAKAYNNRGVLYEKMGILDSAVADYSRSVVIDPSFVVSRLNRARVLVASNKDESALEDLSTAINIEPNNPEIRDQRGKVFLKSGELANALSDFENAIRLNSWYAEAYFHRGQTYQAMGKSEEAQKDFQRAAAIGYKPAVGVK